MVWSTGRIRHFPVTGRGGYHQGAIFSRTFQAVPLVPFRAYLSGVLLAALALAGCHSATVAQAPPLPAAQQPQAAAPATQTATQTTTATQQFDVAHAAWNAEIDASGYNFRFGKDKPFLPSNATTADGKFLQPGAFPTAQYCAHCHEESYHEWRESLHSNSFREPFYRKNVDILIQEKGIEYSRHCEGCHNPIALLSGAVTQNSHIARKFDSDGITCMVCHSIQKLQPEYGLGSYVMGTPAVMVDAQGNPIPGEVPYEQIMAHPERHSAAVMKDFYRSPEYCGSCHKANLPKSVTNYKWLRAIGLYDEWQATSVARQSPLPFYIKNYQSCQDCHMARTEAKLTDYAINSGDVSSGGARDGKIFSHRFLGGNTTTPFYYGFDEQVLKTAEFLKNGTLNVDLFALHKRDAPAADLIAPLGAVSYSVAPGDVLQAYVVIQNKGAAHSLIPEQRDFFEAWVEFVVKDSAGREIYHSGFLKPDLTLDERAHSFTNRLVDDKGKYLANHEIWDRRAVAYDATIQHGRSTLVRYEFKVPAEAKGEITVTARVNYRHFREDYLDFVLGKDHPAYPVVEVASRTRSIHVGENTPDAAPDKQDNLLWQRWNNFAIALLDQQQYADSVQAFEKAAALRPEVANILVSVGLAQITWEKYADARVPLEKALEMLQKQSPGLQPTTSRALFYLAIVERNQGHLEAAVDDLQKVVAAFPRSKDGHRELGFSYYQQRKYREAAEQYEALQAIDPDDLSAHYNLASLYRKLGEKQKAAEQAALFNDKKDDPLTVIPALEFLRSHPDVSNESVPFHIHSDIEPLKTDKPTPPPPGTQG
jgi:Flp pilus assembly protein TadD